jgi:hypothetical protein
MLHRVTRSLQKGAFNPDQGFIRRWPSAPKISFFGPPNVFADEITKR